MIPPLAADGNQHVWHLYVVQTPRRDEVLEHLNRAGIDAGIHYPSPVHLLPAFRNLGWARGSFPRAERFADTILSLPLFPGITEEQQHRVVGALSGALTSARGERG